MTGSHLDFDKNNARQFLISTEGIDTRNSAFNQFNHLIDRIEQVAIATRDPLLLMGATGAGKSLLAKRMYELKKNGRAVEGAFVEVNCATVRGDAALSALSGHVRGAFTGAQKDRPGLLRAADKGVSCFSTKLENWVLMNRRCCFGPWRRRHFFL
jgi:transcriptional regulatory protein RtcR